MSEAKRQVLLVEDSIEEMFLLRSFLEKTGLFQVTPAQDGELAARLIRERPWGLVLTDLNLPGIDGYELIRLVKGKDAATPVIAMTAYTANHYAEEAFRAGANHVLIKPIDRDDLVQKAIDLTPAPKEVHLPPAFVLAIGSLPGDVEGGCGGTLLACRDQGQGVLLTPLSAETVADASTREAQRRSAELMGARIINTGASVRDADDPAEHQLLLERIVRELKPVLAFIPSLADDNPHRREAHRISRNAVADVPTVLAYETGTSTAEFKPTRFVDVAPFMDRKLEVISAYREQARPDLVAGYLQAAARHWGRHLAFGEAEAFEVLRDEGNDV